MQLSKRNDIGTSGRAGGDAALPPYRVQLLRDLRRNKYIYFMVLPVVAYYVIFHYIPIYGIQIAFRDYSPSTGFLNSPFVGFKHFISFFDSYYFWRLIKNTLMINLYELIFGFPMPIIFALLLNEIRRSWFKRTVQTISYLPHFISVVIIAGMITDFVARDGLINQFITMLGGEAIPFLQKAEWFRTIYVGSGIWQGLGWSTIIYLAAISNIDPTLYEASTVDGAGRWRQVLHITIPGILPICIIMLILQIGYMMSVGHEKIILLYNPLTYETADVISTYVFRKGILEASYSFSTAISLFNSVINFALLIIANNISRRVSDTSLW
ncbi:sugar ABC transporter permease [Paenibacillus sp. PAMC21692]|uniref:ABC transporter permease n=1 Tax=Paenibacillus sp. PAMC21692 TaxID=2762320 RepID=UPI00164DB006|nr:ABC transporter permease subunit [Paenibacillus sp. PAMC21692]QNK59319.1 sugar ABC transporter permease [Paenibacillus sp. PAMC21692]